MDLSILLIQLKNYSFKKSTLIGSSPQLYWMLLLYILEQTPSQVLSDAFVELHKIHPLIFVIKQQK